jgi:hypothetical protein
MKKSYDFSKGEKNPYYKKLKGKKLKFTEEVSFDLSDLVKEMKKAKSRPKAAKSTRLDGRNQKRG